jgi:smad nuclear-interacting protein 1
MSRDQKRGRDGDRDRRDRSASLRRKSYGREDVDRKRRDDRQKRRSYSPDRRKDPKDRRDRRNYEDRDNERPSKRRRSDSRTRSPRPPKRSRSHSLYSKHSKAPLPSQNDAFKGQASKTSPPPEKQKPNFSSTGRLAAESNTVTVSGGNSVVLKYHEPPEARKPPAKDAWRLYGFKGPDPLKTVELGERSCWLIGRERAVVDFPVDHPTCSKQHAVIQFRFVEKKNEFGDRIGGVRPYVIDLGSSNGTYVNGDDIPKERYVELRDKDVLKFGLSTREYVLMLPPA